MEPSPSLDATITLRTEQGESHFGARATIDPASGVMQTALDHGELDAAAIPGHDSGADEKTSVLHGGTRSPKTNHFGESNRKSERKG